MPTLHKCVDDVATVYTLIRPITKEQSDLRFLCLYRFIYPKTVDSAQVFESRPESKTVGRFHHEKKKNK